MWLSNRFDKNNNHYLMVNRVETKICMCVSVFEHDSGGSLASIQWINEEKKTGWRKNATERL